MASQSVIDVHSHYLSRSVIERIAYGEIAGVGWQQSDRGTRFTFPGFTSRPLPDRMDELVQRRIHMDEKGIDLQILSTWNDVYGYSLPEREAVSFHTVINEALADAVAAGQGRFRFMASVPLPWSDASAEVLEDAKQRLGAVGVMIGTQIVERDLDEYHLDSFFDAAQRLEMPIEFHPVTVYGQKRLSAYDLDNFLGFPFDSTITATRLILSGVFDKFPRLKVVLVHAGGYLPTSIWRTAYGAHQRNTAPELQRALPEYLDNFYFDSLAYSPEILRYIENVTPRDDQILFGTDYPFNMEPASPVSELVASLGEGSVTGMSGSASRLFNL